MKKIALIGYGKMGQMIGELADRKGMDFIKIDVNHPNANFKSISKEALFDVDVCIDFSNPSSILENVQKIAAEGKNIVIGTTGWYDQMDGIRNIVEKNKIGLVWGANFSIGVNIFYKVVEKAAQLIDNYDDYDIAGIESHHNQKLDKPSGTAKILSDILIKNIERKQSLDFSSIRCGSDPGQHSVVFDSNVDKITLQHQARSRKGFAIGALEAAKWIFGKKGFYNITETIPNCV